MPNICRRIAFEIVSFRSIKVILAWAIISVVVALAGPFGTFGKGAFFWLLLCWSVVVAAALPISVAARVVWNETIKGEPLWLEDFLVVLTITGTFGPLLASFNCWMVSQGRHPTVDWPLIITSTFFISLAAVMVGNIVRSTAEKPIHPEASPKRDRLLERIDAAEGSRLVKVCSDNHHVRIDTDDGQEYRILMRLRDAVAEIDVEKGCCVHRSHWVSVHQISCVEVVDGKEVVRLKDGRKVPIGGKYRNELVDAGLLGLDDSLEVHQAQCRETA